MSAVRFVGTVVIAAAASLVAACSTLPAHTDRTSSTADVDTQDTTLVRLAGKLATGLRRSEAAEGGADDSGIQRAAKKPSARSTR